jgi:primosomal protein N' (replication factor Y)
MKLLPNRQKYCNNMYINVKLLNGFQRALTYKVPPEWDASTVLGSIVTVPLQKRTELALVTHMFEELPVGTTFATRAAIAQEKIPADRHYAAFITKLSAYYALEPLVFYRRLQKFLEQQAVDTEIAAWKTITQAVTQLPQLTDEQQAGLTTIMPAITEQRYEAIVLHGVTGSGKTELYKQALLQAYNNQKTVLFLVPEVSLAVRFKHLLAESMPEIPFFGFHSATGVAEKKELWASLMQKKPIVIVGVHLPLLLPIANLGLIIIDEEHDVGFQEKKHPKINTKEAALLRAQIIGIPVILGSATPSLQSLHNVALKKWALVTLTKRFAGAFPVVKTVSLTSDKQQKRAHFWISRELEQAITDRLAKKEQAIIFINRRGYSFFVQCAACGFVFECPSCSVSLTLHEDQSLRCHYCAYATRQPDRCTKCKPNKPTLLKKGIGTQQVVSILQSLFPEARIARADMDSTVNKKTWQATIAKFHAQELDILVGTQTITKGYHFPGVTLVGIVWADINVHMPFYNAGETTLQQLIQVAGRAGRQSNESLVIVQTMLDHPIFNYINEQDYIKFYNYEIEHRKILNYPPCSRFAELELRNTMEHVLEAESKRCGQILHDFKHTTADYFMILGPAQPPVHKIKNVFSRKIYLKSTSYTAIHGAYQALVQLELSSQLFFTPNPLQ